jgi:integrase
VKASQNQKTEENSESQSVWVKTPDANLVRYKPSGIYFARVRIRGKLFRQSLLTDVISVARQRLRDFIDDKREEMGDDSAVLTGKMTVADAVAIFRQRLDAQQDIKEGAKVYRRKCIEALLKSWPELETMPVGKVGKDACLQWAAKFSAKYSATVYNNTVGTLRMILDVAIEKGARAHNPASVIGKRRIVQRELELPSPEQFERFVSIIEKAGAWCSQECADLVRFLAYGGFRKTEAANITWNDCDFTKGQILVRVTKNGKSRYVPMIPDMRRLLERIKAERLAAQPSDKIMLVQECQKSMDHAADADGVKMKRITHHDLRHLFATRCIEAGVDIPTVSRWLGHQDGGALAMKVYGHLRDHHSAQMAQRVTFSPEPATNVIPMPKEVASA